jgi:hypothetical protein
MRLLKYLKEQDLKDESAVCYASDTTVRRTAKRIFAKYNATFRKLAE